MRIDELDVPDRVADALQRAGFRELHPPQAEAIPITLEGRNLVAAIPTASGKSLIGYVAALKTLVEHQGHVTSTPRTGASTRPTSSSPPPRRRTP